MKKKKWISLLTLLMVVLTGCSTNEHDYDRRRDRDRDYDWEEEEDSSDAQVVHTSTPSSVSEAQESVEIKSDMHSGTQNEIDLTEDVEFIDCGASNIVNSGICCTDGDNFYYSDSNEKKLFRKENAAYTVLADDFFGYYLNTDGDMIYYADAASDNYATAYDLTSGERTVIREMHAQELTLYQEKLYFSCADGNQKTIYRMNTDGSELESLTSCEDLWYMTIYNDVIYYVNYENDIYSIMSMNLDGSDLKVIHSYNASDLCIAEDRIFFAERDTRYLYSMNLDGSDVQQLNSTYSRCINYMDGQLYYFSSEENGHTIYSCDTNGNITGKYASDAKFLVLMDQDIYYYDWDERIHILPLAERSDEENYTYGTDITSYQAEEVLGPVRSYLESSWPDYTMDESSIEKKNNIWTLNLFVNGNDEKYRLIINLTTGKITILNISEDALPISVYLFEDASANGHL